MLIQYEVGNIAWIVDQNNKGEYTEREIRINRIELFDSSRVLYNGLYPPGMLHSTKISCSIAIAIAERRWDDVIELGKQLQSEVAKNTEKPS